MFVGIGLAITRPARSVAPPLPSTAWNPADKNASITLSNSNLTATGAGGSWQNARSVNSRADTTGRFFEYAKTGGNFTGICIANATASLSANGGSDTNSCMFLSNGEVIYGGATLTTLVSYTTETIGVAYKAGKVWFYVNGVLWTTGDPAAGTGGHAVPGIGSTVFAMFSDTSGNSGTLNTGGPFVGSVPSGFVAFG